jgi:hypothetical protein
VVHKIYKSSILQFVENVLEHIGRGSFMSFRHVFFAWLMCVVMLGCSGNNSEKSDGVAPGIPSGVTTTAGNGLINITWSANEEADVSGYTVYWGTSESNLDLTKKVSKSLTATVLEGLSNGTAYYVALSATDTSGNESERSVVRSATPTDAPVGTGSLTPTNVAVVAGDKEIKITWSVTQPEKIKEFVIFWGESASGSAQFKKVDKDTRSTTITGLNNALTYYVAMSAITTTGEESVKTAVQTVTPVDSSSQPPNTPEAIVIVPGDSKITMSWAANIEPDLAGYVIYYGTDRARLEQTRRVPASATSAEIIGLSNATTYYVALSAVDTTSKESMKTEPQPATPVKPDTTAPGIATTAPGNNAEISQAIIVTFSEAMNAASVQVSILPNTEIDSRVWSTDAKSLTLRSKQPLEYDTRYEVRLTGTDQAGNSLTGTTTFAFTTRKIPDTVSPFVTTTLPDDAATSAPATGNISVSFSEPMNRVSVEQAFSISSEVDCVFFWTEDNRLLTCDPAENLAFLTLFTVALTTAAQDEAGNGLASNYSFSFTTTNAPDNTSPSIVVTQPAKGERGVALDPSIIVTFSEPMDRLSAEEAFVITSPVSREGVFTWNDEGTQMTFSPDRYYGFYYGEDVAWRIENNAKDQAGNPLAASYLSEFKIRRLEYINLYSESALDGYVQSNGGVYASDSWVPIGNLYNNIYSRGFFTFDLSQLPDDVLGINYASFYPNQQYYNYSGNPQANLTTPDQLGVLLESVEYGDSLDFTDFEKAPINFCSTGSTCNSTIVMNMYENTIYYADLTELVKFELNADASLNSSKAQIRLRFPKNQSYSYDYIYLYADYVTNEYKPSLWIGYEVP